MLPEFNLDYHYKLNYRRNYNILAEDYKVIYFNTQKNANSTMKAQFVDVLGMTKTKDFPNDVHHSYNFPTASQNEIRSLYKDYLRFLILRNPWERLVSCYKSKIEQNCRFGTDYILECSPDLYIGMSFEEFVAVVCKIPDSDADYHFCSQSYLMLYPDGYFPINYFCNMENLTSHMEEINSLTGIPFSPLSNLNSSNNSSYQCFYTSKLIEKVRQRYYVDIELFKYEFGKKNEAFSFGSVGTDFKKKLTESPLMIQLLKEKNIESLKTIESRPELERALKEMKSLKKELEMMNDSLSWKITKPLRSVWTYIFG